MNTRTDDNEEGCDEFYCDSNEQENCLTTWIYSLLKKRPVNSNNILFKKNNPMIHRFPHAMKKIHIVMLLHSLLLHLIKLHFNFLNP
jgi:hypothetical protein